MGPNGHGKSWLACMDVLPGLEYGRPVLSTVRFLDYRNPRPCDDPSCDWPGHPDHLAAHPLWTGLRDYSQLLDARDCSVILDEVTGVASSRESANMPVQVSNWLVQLRRRNIDLTWTAPAWGRSDLIIREVTQAVSVCLGYFPKRRKQDPNEPPRLWTDRQGFYVRTYESLLMDDFEAGKAQHIPHIVAAFYWRPGGLTERAYDTLDAVSSLGWANEAGMCMGCGGKRTIPRCSCGTHDEGRGAARDRSRARAAAELAAPDSDPVGPVADLGATVHTLTLEGNPLPLPDWNLADTPA